jgi:hypothetical protein
VFLLVLLLKLLSLAYPNLLGTKGYVVVVVVVVGVLFLISLSSNIRSMQLGKQ